MGIRGFAFNNVSNDIKLLSSLDTGFALFSSADEFFFNVIVCIALACSPSALLSGFCGSMLYFQIQFLAFILIQKHEQLHCQGLRESPAVTF